MSPLKMVCARVGVRRESQQPPGVRSFGHPPPPGPIVLRSAAGLFHEPDFFTRSEKCLRMKISGRGGLVPIGQVANGP